MLEIGSSGNDCDLGVVSIDVSGSEEDWQRVCRANEVSSGSVDECVHVNEGGDKCAQSGSYRERSLRLSRVHRSCGLSSKDEEGGFVEHKGGTRGKVEGLEVDLICEGHIVEFNNIEPISSDGGKGDLGSKGGRAWGARSSKHSTYEHNETHQ